MSKLPDTIAWTESSLTLLEQTDKSSVKSVAVTIGKAAEVKETKEAAMVAVTDLAKWAKGEKALFVEPYLITLFPTIMALCADKQRPVQIKAEEAGAAMVRRRTRRPSFSRLGATPAPPLTRSPPSPCEIPALIAPYNLGPYYA